jgi:hypothetical protein
MSSRFWSNSVAIAYRLVVLKARACARTNRITSLAKEVTMKLHHHLTLIAALALVAVMSTSAAMAPAATQDEPPAAPGQNMPPMPPPPGEHHKWLQKLVGNWTVEMEMNAEGMPPMKSTGTTSVRSLEGRWVIGELKAETPGMGSMNAILTLGYNPETGKYQGTWIDSMTDVMWVYVGTLDATKKILTLEAEGPNMMDPAAKEKVKYRDVIEFKTDDHHTLTSSAYMGGKWVQFVTANYRRTK